MGVNIDSSEDPARRPSILRGLLLALIAAAAMPNGMFFSPLFDSVLFMIPRTAAAFFVKGSTATFYLTGIALWLLTLVLAGIPAAIYDRVRGLPHGSMASLVIWLLTAFVLSFPSLQAAFELFAEP